ncbi:MULTISPECIES: hypothetical protein [Acinetobacter Taxon 24D]|jgi:5-methyltetrahydropteroyltriglutamate--homocysteine methyltransferase|uniref:hypothetical protein n=1 Tax=Acinetobacter Taxon 24D TaxID=2839057 RepID=UPI00103BC45D|nr:hypothetical protein [Acinetobacter sp. ANC 5414]TCH64718.1 hypothetical protein E0409_04325 [Acinetobacter sp. ANC 4862]
MTITSHILGYPRVGAKRELKFACESYRKGESTQVEFLTKAQTVTVEANNWQAQIKDSPFLGVIFI